MRKILFLAVLIASCCLPAFSQSISQLQVDTTSVKFGILNATKSLGHFDSLDFKLLLKNTETHKYLLDPNLASREVHFGQLNNLRISTPHSFDNMPCLYPQGTFPMPVYKPDSNVRYTLLIKKYK